MDNKNQNSIQSSVVEAIKSGEVSMKPRWQFVLQTMFTILLSTIFFFTLIYLISFIGLIIHEKHLFDVFNLGPRGLPQFLLSLPWVIVLLSFFFLIVFYILVKKYSFVYERPFVYSFLGLIFLTLVIGFIIHMVDVRYRFARFGEGPHAPVLGPIHRYYRGDIQDRIEFQRPPFPPQPF